MFASQNPPHGFESLGGIIASSVILPPVGLVLVWLRKKTRLAPKILATLGIVILSGVYFQAFKAWRNSSANEAQYSALEQHRAQQQAQAAQSSTTAAPQPAAVAGQSPASGQPGAPGTSTDAAAAHATKLLD